MTIDSKIRALLAKTIKVGATPGEQQAAVAKARALVTKHGLDAAVFTWPPEPKKPSKRAPRARRAAKPGKASHQSAKATTKPAKRPTRGDEVVELLRRKNGAAIAEMVTRFRLQPHTLRAVISIESRKRGLNVELVGKAHYRIVK